MKLLDDIKSFLREPYCIGLRYYALLVLLMRPSLMAVVALATSYGLTFVLSGFASAASSMKSARDFLRYFEEDPGILSLQEFELPTEDEWRSRFMLLNFKHKTDPVLRGAPPLRMFDRMYRSAVFIFQVLR